MDMRALVDYLNETAYQYYTLGEPTISDAEWDKKYDELRRMEEETGERLPDSPTRRVGAQPLANFEQHTHLARLWSLDKAQSVGALREWAARAEKLRREANDGGANLPPVSYVVEYKFDGLTISLTYENGLFTCPECGGECDAAELIALYDDIRAGHVSDAEVVGLWIEKLDARRVA